MFQLYQHQAFQQGKALQKVVFKKVSFLSIFKEDALTLFKLKAKTINKIINECLKGFPKIPENKKKRVYGIPFKAIKSNDKNGIAKANPFKLKNINS